MAALTCVIWSVQTRVTCSAEEKQSISQDIVYVGCSDTADGDNQLTAASLPVDDYTPTTFSSAERTTSVTSVGLSKVPFPNSSYTLKYLLRESCPWQAFRQQPLQRRKLIGDCSVFIVSTAVTARATSIDRILPCCTTEPRIFILVENNST